MKTLIDQLGESIDRVDYTEEWPADWVQQDRQLGGLLQALYDLRNLIGPMIIAAERAQGLQEKQVWQKVAKQVDVFQDLRHDMTQALSYWDVKKGKPQ